ncbi:MAG TPA: hypothetical protein VMW16_07620 [Sedimentisphaerales bacterium]|nr:hypothetical protein [Sedimentisphaerales bacterium]
MSRFETEILAQPENLAFLMSVPGMWVDTVHRGTRITEEESPLEVCRKNAKMLDLRRIRAFAGLQASRAPWTGFEKGVLMLTRITCPNKWMDDRQAIDDKSFSAPLAGNSKASYMVRNDQSRILCGSI